MKKILLPVLALLLFACNNNKKSGKEMLIGTWRPVELSGMDMDEEEKKNILEKASIEFTKEGKYFSRFDGEDQDGTWTYDEKIKKLSTDPANGDNKELFSVDWSEDTLLLINVRKETIKMKKK